MEQNQNSNHAKSTTNGRKILRSVVHEVNKPHSSKKNKKATQVENSEEFLNEENSTLTDQWMDEDELSSQYDEGQNDNLQTAEFVEEGEIIQMEIDDGGQAAEEFGSESDNPTDSEDEVTTENPQSDGQTDAEESDLNKTQCDNKDEGDNRRVTIKKKKQRMSVEDKLEGMSNA